MLVSSWGQQRGIDTESLAWETAEVYWTALWRDGSY